MFSETPNVQSLTLLVVGTRIVQFHAFCLHVHQTGLGYHYGLWNYIWTCCCYHSVDISHQVTYTHPTSTTFLLFTKFRNVILGFFALVSIMLVILCFAFVMKAIGWTIGFIESVAMTIVVS